MGFNSHAAKPMETWRYLNQDLVVQILHISNYFSQQVGERGTFDEGELKFVSVRSVDEVFGPECTITVKWEKKDPTTYHHGLKVKETMRMFSSINVLITQKENKWLLSHELTYWIGSRQRFERGRYYPVNIIHTVHYCDLTQRLFEIHAEIYSKYYPNYYPLVMQFIDSFQCHGS